MSLKKVQVSTKGDDGEDVAASEALLELQDTLETQNPFRVSFGSSGATHNDSVNSVTSKTEISSSDDAPEDDDVEPEGWLTGKLHLLME